MHFFDDTGKGGCRPPSRFEVEAWTDGKWQAVEGTKRTPSDPAAGENAVAFAQPVKTEKLRLVLHHAGASNYTGIYGFEATGDESAASAGTPRSDSVCA